MARRSILQEGRSYIFSEYFKLAVDPEDLLREFGFALGKAQLDLARFEGGDGLAIASSPD